MATKQEVEIARHRSIHWIRKGMRLHDNPSLLTTLNNSSEIWPVFILDPWFVKNYKVGENRWRFLAQSLEDLDKQIKVLGGRLFVVRGNPKEVIPDLIEKWNISQVSFEVDTEPYALSRDAEVEATCSKLNCDVIKKVSHTLYDTEKVIAKNGGKAPMTYQSCQALLSKVGPPSKPAPAVDKQLLAEKDCRFTDEYFDAAEHAVPSLKELGVVDENKLGTCLFPGGETEALQRMEAQLKKTNWVLTFEKPKTEPNSLSPSTTVLSPYLKFGCLSSRTFYWKLHEIYSKSKKHSQPPVSLHGQLLWREFFYTVGYATENFNKMAGNKICRQIPWQDNPEHLEAWKNGKTGYPYIDAIMIQLKREGWIHHLARHSVACFLTRGDLWISWEKGQEVFEEYLLDADWFLNAANWMWLSASAFFHQFFRVYSPIAFGKKTDKSGAYIKKYLPQLKKYPEKYIYEPWTAPRSVQEAAGCIIGKDYPKPIVDHDKVRVINIDRMKKAYDANKADAASNGSTGSSTPKRKNSAKIASDSQKKKERKSQKATQSKRKSNAEDTPSKKRKASTKSKPLMDSFSDSD